MDRNGSTVPQRRSSTRKRKIQPFPNQKKLRSKIPRRKRFRISPITSGSLNLLFRDRKTEVSAFPEVSSSSSCLFRENSCGSSLISFGSEEMNKKHRSCLQKRGFEEIRASEAVVRTDVRCFNESEKIPGEKLRRITRSYGRNKDKEKKGNRNFGVELSEFSCVESSSGAPAFTERNTSFRSSPRKVVEEAEENQGTAVSAVSTAIAVSDVSSISQGNAPKLVELDEKSDKNWNQMAKTSTDAENSPENIGHEDTSETSCIESLSEAKYQNQCPLIRNSSEKTIKNEENKVAGAEFSVLSRNCAESSLAVSNSESTTEQKPNCFEYDSDLACSEQFSCEDDSDFSTRHGYFELDSELFPKSSDLELTDYTPSFLESATDFSERSAQNSSPSACFSFILQYKQQFSELNPRPDVKDSSRAEDECLDDFTFLCFEDNDDEESYTNFRNRERRQVFLHDYADYYCSSAEYGDLVLQQRLLMVNWIVEQTNTRELQFETMFLGVGLLDRFLCRGFFKNRENLQLVGIACLTLACRIEENQPLNCVRQKTFKVGINLYSRSEVVAMEWMVQEVLNFRCFLPTTYNFLWFYLKAARADPEVEKRAKNLAVLSLLNHEQLGYWPSTVAAGLVILASFAANQDSSCKLVMETHVRTKDDDLAECIKSLEWLLKHLS